MLFVYLITVIVSTLYELTIKLVLITQYQDLLMMKITGKLSNGNFLP